MTKRKALFAAIAAFAGLSSGAAKFAPLAMKEEGDTTDFTPSTAVSGAFKALETPVPLEVSIDLDTYRTFTFNFQDRTETISAEELFAGLSTTE